MAELLRVIAVGHSAPRRSGGVAVLGSVELWTDAIVLRIAEVSSADPPPSPADAAPASSFVDWQVFDDLGNEYALSGGPMRGGVGRILGTLLYRPGVAENATRLRIVTPELADGVSIDVELKE
jgi:hypothetical protein